MTGASRVFEVAKRYDAFSVRCGDGIVFHPQSRLPAKVTQ
jgi:hypothetical protein